MTVVPAGTLESVADDPVDSIGRPDRASIEPLWTAEIERPPAARGNTRPASAENADAPGAVRGGTLPQAIHGPTGSTFHVSLRPDRPTVIANFVSTLDGVVALDRAGASGGREISGFSDTDRRYMGLLRATADAVLIGAGTVRASRSKTWTPESAHPSSAQGYALWRRSLGLAAAGPATVIVSGSGDVGALSTLTGTSAARVIVTTEHGARALRGRADLRGADLVIAAEKPPIGARALLQVLQSLGYALVLSEAGPTLFSALVRAQLVDELFLTLAPQLAGRGPVLERRSLIEGVDLAAVLPTWARLASVQRSNDHLFLRYDLRTASKGVR